MRWLTICSAICSRSSAVSTRPANVSIARLLSRRCWRGAITIWSGAGREERRQRFASPNGSRSEHARAGRNTTPAASPRDRKSGGRSWRLCYGDAAIRRQQTKCAAALVSFDSAAFSTEIDKMISHCTPELMARAAELGSRDETPILIIGMPRSGTTLVEQIISMHPEVGAGDELNFWNERGAAMASLWRGRKRKTLSRQGRCRLSPTVT